MSISLDMLNAGAMSWMIRRWGTLLATPRVSNTSPLCQTNPQTTYKYAAIVQDLFESRLSVLQGLLPFLARRLPRGGDVLLPDCLYR